MSILSLPEKELRAILRASVGPDGSVIFTRHVREQMETRNIVERDIVRVLKHGLPDEGRAVSWENGSWRYRRRHGRAVVVVAVYPPAKTVVVTAF